MEASKKAIAEHIGKPLAIEVMEAAEAVIQVANAKMAGAIRLSSYLKNKNINAPIIFVGSHVQALPSQTLEKEKSIDIVCLNDDESVRLLW